MIKMDNDSRNAMLEVMADELITTYGLESLVTIQFCNEMEEVIDFNRHASEERNIEIVKEMEEYKKHLVKYTA